MKDKNWNRATEHPASDPNCSNGTSINVQIWHPTLEYDGWVCEGYYHPKAGEWWSWGYGRFTGDDSFLRWRPISDDPWEKPDDIDWDAVAMKWRAGEAVSQAIDVFGSEERAYDWLQTPLSSLGGQTPDKVLDSQPELISQLLGEINQ